MATTFNWIYLGTSNTSLDTFEGGTNMENAGSFVGTTFGSSGDPLYGHVTSVTMSSTGGQSGVMDTDNLFHSDTFMTDMGGGYATWPRPWTAEDPWAAMRETHDGLFFAVSELAAAYPGFIEGAVRSGREVAARILQQG